MNLAYLMVTTICIKIVLCIRSTVSCWFFYFNNIHACYRNVKWPNQVFCINVYTYWIAALEAPSFNQNIISARHCSYLFDKAIPNRYATLPILQLNKSWFYLFLLWKVEHTRMFYRAWSEEITWESTWTSNHFQLV